MKTQCNRLRLQACHPKSMGRNSQQGNKHESEDVANELPISNVITC